MSDQSRDRQAERDREERAEAEGTEAERQAAAERAGGEAESADRAGDAEPNPAYELEKAMQEVEAERDKLFERLQRVSADYQNYMKRTEQELGRAIDRSRGDLLKGFIPVLDDFDKALANEPESEEAQALYQGVKMVHEELLKVLSNAGVERLEVAVGDAFDPHRHEALMQQPVEGVEGGRVAAMMQPGYVYGDRTLRAAKVAVTPNT